MKLVLAFSLIITCTYLILMRNDAPSPPQTTSTSQDREQRLVQNMASFLESNPEIQRRIASETESKSTESIISTPLSDQYFSDSNVDSVLKSMVHSQSRDHLETTRTRGIHSPEAIQFILENPAECIDRLEQILTSIPPDLENERAILIDAYLIAVSAQLEQQDWTPLKKQNHLRDLIEKTAHSEIKKRLEVRYQGINDVASATEAAQETMTEETSETSD